MQLEIICCTVAEYLQSKNYACKPYSILELSDMQPLINTVPYVKYIENFFSALRAVVLVLNRACLWLSGLPKGTEVLAHLGIHKYALVAELEN